MIEHAFGIEVVALLHHARENLIEGMRKRRSTPALSCRKGVLIDEGIDKDDTCGLKFTGETLKEVVLTAHEQRRETRVIVIPAPTFTKQQRVLHRPIGNNAATDGIDAGRANAVDEYLQVATVEGWIHAAHADEVAIKSVTDERATRAQLSGKRMIAAIEVEGRHSGHQLHRRCRAHALPVVMIVEGGVAIEVPHHQA